MRRFHATPLCPTVGVPNRTSVQQLLSQSRRQGLRQHDHPVFTTFGFSHDARDDHVLVQIHVFDPQPQAFHQPHTGAVEQLGQKSHFVVPKLKQRRDIFTRQHAGYPPLLCGPIQTNEPRKIDARYVVIKKQQGTEGLVVR
jgi:hypothetical protein